MARSARLLAVFLVGATAASLVAIDASAAKDTRSERSKRAAKLIRSGQIAAGIRLLEDVHEEVADPKILLDIANVYDEWGEHCPSVIDAFRRFFQACESCEWRERAT